ncbi:MAG: glycosyltransferase family 2 protein [Synergistaceae bacterium]|nr:glycosyltransferase family 2 protein [Synergistaceae bacterium]
MITLQEILERDKRPPSVTVAMTCYNHAKYLDEALHGVLMQKTNFPVNIVVHDDASPDGSAEIIRRYAAENPNITAILQPVNLMQNGKSVMRAMLPYYTGKYLAYCECDDFWIDEHKLQRQVDYLEANPDCVAVYHRTQFVNKYSENYDSADFFRVTGEGDYPRDKLFGVEHQMATCVARNFWRLITPEDIDFYTHLKGPGDQRIMAILLRLGRVHYFGEKMSAYRFVTEDGDSYSARMNRLSEYDRYKHVIFWRSEIYVMLEHFFGKKYLRKYIEVLWEELRSYRKYHRSVIKDANLNECYHYRNIPLWVWPVFAGYVSWRAAKKFAKMILPNKVLTAIKKLRYNALCSLLSALSSQLWL